MWRIGKDQPSEVVNSESATPPWKIKSELSRKGATRDVATLAIQAQPLTATLQVPRGQVGMDREKKRSATHDEVSAPRQLLWTCSTNLWNHLVKKFPRCTHGNRTPPGGRTQLCLGKWAFVSLHPRGCEVVCIPQALVLNYLYQNHNTPGAAHGGSNRHLQAHSSTLLLAYTNS